eukprot:8865216-Pyramimonas_sp.AAC.2
MYARKLILLHPAVGLTQYLYRLRLKAATAAFKEEDPEDEFESAHSQVSDDDSNNNVLRWDTTPVGKLGLLRKRMSSGQAESLMFSSEDDQWKSDDTDNVGSPGNVIYRGGYNPPRAWQTVLGKWNLRCTRQLVRIT